MDQNPITPQVPESSVNSGLSRAVKIFIAIYAVLAVFILLGADTYGAIGDWVRMTTIPMFVTAILLAVSLLSYGIQLSTKKESPMVVRVLAPIVGLAVGAAVFMGGAFIALTALMSNVREGGGGS